MDLWHRRRRVLANPSGNGRGYYDSEELLIIVESEGERRKTIKERQREVGETAREPLATR